MPIAAIADTLLTFADVGLGADLHERLAGETSWPARFALLDRLLLARLDATAHRAPADVTHAWDLLAQAHGRVPVQALAEWTGWSRRHLQTRFRAEYGVSPKQAARLFRFQHARALSLAGRPLAAVAHHAGYADQAHLTRDWCELAGTPPTVTLRELFPILQDVTEDAVGG